MKGSLQIIRMMGKITIYTLILTAVLFNVLLANKGHSQIKSVREARISIDIIDQSLTEALDVIEENSEYHFIYVKSELKANSKIPINASIRDETIETLLLQISRQADVAFRQVNNQISVRNNPIRSNKKRVEIVVAQTISGIVTDENGEPLPGATVLEKGTTNGTSTDINGKYQLNCPEDAVLVISFVGYSSKEISVNNQSVINVELLLDTDQLEEVVVVGYGTQKKRDLTGAVGIIDGEGIASRRVTNISNALQGAVPGVTVTRTSSAPGSGNSVLIRGITTLQGESSPLILVDNIPVASMNDVNPENVESISVLKDGASAAIYGSRAAAGVILITTKRAKENTFSVEYSGEVISNVPTEFRKTVDAVRYMEMQNEKQWNDNGNDADQFPVWSEDLITNYASYHASDPDQYPNTNWRDLVFKKSAPAHRHNLLMVGGADKLKTLAAFGYEYQGALYNQRSWERYTGRINNDLAVNDKFGATLNLAFRITDDKQPVLDPTKRAVESAPIYPAVWQDGRIAEGKTGDNIYARVNYGGTREVASNLLYGKFELYIEPIEGLRLSVNLAPNIEFTKLKQFNRAIPYWASDDPNRLEDPFYIGNHNINQISLNERRIHDFSLTKQAIANYKKRFGDHSLDITLGQEAYSSFSEGLRVTGIEYISNDYPYLSQAPVDKVFDDGTSIVENAYISTFGRLSYNFDSKYFLQATARRDGSSRFGPDYRWGVFPSVAAGWVLSNEEFLRSVDVISFAKLRVSYGQLGNDRLGNYLYQSLLQFSNVYLANGSSVEAARSAAQLYLAVDDVTWETTSTINVGLDLGFFKDKLSATFDYFSKETTDMLLELSIPSLSGYNDPTVNVGSMSTKGWEFSTTWREKIGELNYSVSFNVFDSESIVGNVNQKRLFSGNYLSEEGIEFQSWYGYIAEGIFQTQEEVDNSPVTSASVGPGDIKYKDISGPNDIPDGVINELDRVVLGGSQPRMQYGGNVNLEYKGIDFGLVFQGVGKKNYYLSPDFTQPFQESWLSPPALLDGNYWSMYNTADQNLSATYPRLAETTRDNNYLFSDFWLRDGAYFRVKNITLGYTLPPNLISKLGIAKLRIYVAANDIFTLADFPSGIDPEGGSGYLITKSFMAGVKIGF